MNGHLPAATGATQGRSLVPMSETELTGRLVVAAPSLADPNFAHTVVLLLEHGADGAVGLVLNRPSETSVSSVLPPWQASAAAPAVVFVGGPVQAGEAMIGLGRVGGEEALGGPPLLPGVTVVDLSEESPPADVQVVRLFTGYSGWGAGQLEQELEAGGWFLVDGGPDDPFDDDPGRLWRSVLVRQGGMFSTVPEDPSHN